MSAPRHSPWGWVDHSKTLADGIVEVQTPSHGGIHLSPERVAMMPDVARRPGGWYEEDCEWSLVALRFPEAFTSKQHALALKTARGWLPDECRVLVSTGATS